MAKVIDQSDLKKKAAQLRKLARQAEEAAGVRPKARDGFATNIDRAAAEIGVNRRTLYEWSQHLDFPKKTHDGYDLFAILEWIDKRGKGKQGSAGPRDSGGAKERLETAKAAREELKLGRDLQQLLDADDVTRLLERVVATAQAVLGQIPDRIEQALPPEFSPALKERIRKLSHQVLRDAFAIIEQGLAGDEDDEETDDEPNDLDDETESN